MSTPPDRTIGAPIDPASIDSAPIDSAPIDPASIDPATVETMRRVATHIVARARFQGTQRFSLRATVGGFGTPEFGADARRVRVAGDVLVVESDAPGAAATQTAKLGGSTMERLAMFAGVDLAAPFDAGHDTPDLGDIDAVIQLDPAAAVAVCAWYQTAATILDRVVAELPTTAAPSLTRLWPEHFDLAIDVEARPGVRVNLGLSPGDGGIAEPYAYVGPWTDDRPGEGSYWNASFGASSVASAWSTIADAVAFMREGVDRLGGLREGG